MKPPSLPGLSDTSSSRPAAGPRKLYATARQAREALGIDDPSDGGVAVLHVYLGGICEEVQCSCGVAMPLTGDGSPALSFEEWIVFHDQKLNAVTVPVSSGGGPVPDGGRYGK